MKHIYCISGLGADERVFSKCDFPGHEVHFINWIIPGKNDTIESYAKKMIEHIHHDNPILIGLSFGGIMCIEISRLIKTELVIIISSVKSTSELPFWLRVSGKLKLNRLLPMRSFKILEPIQNYNLGITTEDEKALVREYRKNINQQYADWAINALLNWKSKEAPKKLYHIHGAKDRIFSIKRINPDYTIRDGGHLMIMQKTDELNQIIHSILKNKI